MAYQWDSPYQWLMDFAAKLNPSELFQEFSVIAGKLDSDTIQDLYQHEMEMDGYFKEVEERSEVCPQCEGILATCNGYCEGTGKVTKSSADEWHRQND